MKMQVIPHSYSRLNFHRADVLALNIQRKNIIGRKVYLTKSQTKRVSDHFCGCTGCTCGSAPAYITDGEGNVYQVEGHTSL